MYSQSEVQISAWSCGGCLSEVEGGFMGLASLVVQLVKNPLANAEALSYAPNQGKVCSIIHNYLYSSEISGFKW